MIATTFDRRCRARRRRTSAVMVALVAFVPLACGEPKDASLCTAFEEYLDIRAQVAAVDAADLTTTTAGDATEARRGLPCRRQASRAGRRRALRHRARHARDGGQRPAVHARSVQDDADFATWAPAGRGRSGTGRGRGRRRPRRSIAPSCIAERNRNIEHLGHGRRARWTVCCSQSRRWSSIGAIVMGTKSSGVALGIWGGVGVAVLVFVFGLEPGSPAGRRDPDHPVGDPGGGDDAGGRRHRLDGGDGGQGDPEPPEAGHVHRPAHVVPVLPRCRHRQHRVPAAAGDLRRLVPGQGSARSGRCR